MRWTTIVTAKIRPEIYDRIENGKKNWEIRDEPFGNAKAIRYIDSETGKLLGYCEISWTCYLARTYDPLLIDLAQVDSQTFYDLFPADGPIRLYAAQLGMGADRAEFILREGDSE
jgi:hypothetical protein